MVAFAVQSCRHLVERHARDLFDKHVPLSSLHRHAIELWRPGQRDTTHQHVVVQRHGRSYDRDRQRKRRHVEKARAHQRKLRSRHNGATACGPVTPRPLPSQRRRREDLSRAKQRPRFQNKIRRSGLARMEVQVEALAKGTAKYPMRCINCTVSSIPQGTMSHTHENVYLGVLPKRVVLCCIDIDPLNGTYNKNPSTPSTTNFLIVYVDGRQVPSMPLQPRFAKGTYIRSYLNLFAAPGKAFYDDGNDLTRTEFGTGYTVFGFDLLPDACDGAHFNLSRKSNLRMEVHYGTALQEALKVVVYGEFETVLEIDRSRNVVYDYW